MLSPQIRFCPDIILSIYETILQFAWSLTNGGSIEAISSFICKHSSTVLINDSRYAQLRYPKALCTSGKPVVKDLC